MTRWEETLQSLKRRWNSEEWQNFKLRDAERERKAQERQNQMINLSGQDFNGNAKMATLEEGTYACTLIGAKIYRNENFEKTDLVTQIDLIWDTGDMIENDDGEEVQALIYDSFVTLSLNEKAKLTSRLKALIGKDFNPNKANVRMEIEGHDDLKTLPHRSEGKPKVSVFEVDGESVFGKQGMVAVEINKNNYNRVMGVSAPMRSPGTKRAAPAGAPA